MPRKLPLITLAAVSATALMIALSACESPPEAKPINVAEAARYATGVFDQSAAEIVAYSPANQTLYFTNASEPSVQILKLAKGADGKATLTPMGTLALTKDENPTSVAVSNGLVAVAVHKEGPGRPGKVVFFSEDSGERLGEALTGSLPDMVTFTPDGSMVLTADEGEPSEGPDPKGTVTIINVANYSAHTIGFSSFDSAALKARGVRIFPGKDIAEDAEPEYIAISPDGTTAFVSLQENNALAVVDLGKEEIVDVLPFGTKDYSLPHNGIDTNDKADPGLIQPVPVRGMYMPDAIAAYEANGRTYVITANEGDARDEDERVKKANLDQNALRDEDRAKIGDRLKISTIDGDTDGDGDIDVLYSYGARSFSIWSENGTLVYDSGDDFEQKTLIRLGPSGFNSNNDENNSGDNRSDDKGPEPEGVAIGEIDGRTIAFIGMERVGGIMVYDVSDPEGPEFITYIVDRNYNPTLDPASAGDLEAIGNLGPEGMTFVRANDNPLGVPLLIVAYEVSGTVAVYTLQ